MTHLDRFHAAFARAPLVAILRGVRPDEIVAIGEALVEAGIVIIEVPLNSPEPLESIRLLAARLSGRALVGAGTVLSVQNTHAVAGAGGGIIVSPGAETDVIAATVAMGMVAAPGVFTPTEAFAALRAGAHALKIFPAEAAPPPFVKALRAVLPADVPILMVGGIAPGTMAAYRAAGANGFGLGSALYKPGRSAAEVGAAARAFVAAL